MGYGVLTAGEFTAGTIGADMGFCQRKFIDLLMPGELILDAGCGSGRDSRSFLMHGFRVKALDVSTEMCRIASEYIGQPMKCMQFEELEEVFLRNGLFEAAESFETEDARPDFKHKP